MKSDAAKRYEKARFICRVCGIEALEPVLCTKDDCMTAVLVHCAASSKKQ